MLAYESVRDLAASVAGRLIDTPGVRAVVLGGSWARGAGDESSDIDLGIYYDPDQPPDLTHLRALAAGMDDSGSGEAVTDFGAWGAWINGGAWLTMGGQRVDWLYRDLTQVRGHIDACVAGRPEAHYQPGHPHAFQTHIYLAEVAVCKLLADPYGEVGALKRRTQPYPLALKQALISGNLWEAQFALETSRKAALRGDTIYVTGALFRSLACLLQVIFALNEQYWLNEKGAIRAVAAMPLCPRDFARRTQQLLGHVGVGAAGLQSTHNLFQHLVSEVNELCAEQGFASL